MQHKAYSVLKTSGRFNDFAIASILGAWSYESGAGKGGIRSSSIEGNLVDATYIKTVEDLDNYTASHPNLTASVYYIKNNGYLCGSNWGPYSGYHLCGIGMAQYTWGSAGRLIDFANARNIPWQSIDTQLMWALTKAPSSFGGDKRDGSLGYGRDLFSTVLTKDYPNLYATSQAFMTNYEGINLTGSTDPHYTNAKYFYAKLPTYEADEEYAEGILKDAGFEKKADGRWGRK